MLSSVDQVSSRMKNVSSAVAAIKTLIFSLARPLTIKNKLQSLQNRAARIGTRTKHGCIEPDQLLGGGRLKPKDQSLATDFHSKSSISEMKGRRGGGGGGVKAYIF